MFTRGSGRHLSPLSRFLDAVEWAGNRLPHPATMFALLAVSVIIGSAMLSGLGYVAAHPACMMEF